VVRKAEVVDSGTLAYVKALRYTGVAGGVLGMGLSYAQIRNDINMGQPVNPWDVADFTMGFVGTSGSAGVLWLGLSATGPAGWVVGGAAVYFGGRLFHNIAVRE
jgi:hypothetical protein